MSKSKGEGRAPSEKAQRYIISAAERRARTQAAKQQEEDWASRSGPVTVSRIEPKDKK